jgi:predicted ATPase
MEAWPATRGRAGAGRPCLSCVRGITIFVGRARELQALDERLEEALAVQGKVVLVSGEPVVGKTCLVEALTRRAEARGFVVAGTRLERAVVAEIVGAASGNAAKKADGATLWARLGSPAG